MSTAYPKIRSPYMRHTEGPLRNKLDPTRWSRPEFGLLAGLEWEWLEKVDGTNIRVIWDGHRVEFGGRTDSAQIPAALVSVLRELFPEEIMENQFNDTPTVLYGEGYGPKIQKGGERYRDTPGFALFDVRCNGFWLNQAAVDDIAAKMGLSWAPLVMVGTVWDAIERVSGNGLASRFGDFVAEGLVGRPPLGILGRDGDRLMMKVKSVDFTDRGK